jgi:serine/threonine protein kinase
MDMETPHSAVPDDMVGKAIGHYIVRRKLGEGGMGSVYVAEHPAVGKRVALEVLPLPGYLAATRKVAASADVALSLSLDRAPQGAPPPAPGGTSSPR